MRLGREKKAVTIRIFVGTSPRQDNRVLTAVIGSNDEGGG